MGESIPDLPHGIYAVSDNAIAYTKRVGGDNFRVERCQRTSFVSEFGPSIIVAARKMSTEQLVKFIFK